MKKTTALCLLLAGAACAQAKSYTVASPDGALSINVDTGKELTWSVNVDGDAAVLPSPISLTLSDGRSLGRDPKVTKSRLQSVDTEFATPLYHKTSVTDRYNELTLDMRGGYALQLRAYDDAAAYRFILRQSADNVTITDEQATFAFGGDRKAWLPFNNDLRDPSYPYSFAFESYYDEIPLAQMPADTLSITPALIELPQGRKALVMEGLLDNYPGMFLRRSADGNADYVDKLMDKFAPKEVLVERGRRRLLDETFSAAYLSFELDDWIFTADAARERLLKQFGTTSLKGFGITAMPSAVIAAGAAMHYLDITNHTQTAHITKLARIEEENYVRLDKFTVRNLELVNPLGEEGRSLLDILDTTVTPMGARMMRRWLLFPLKDTEAINARLDAVEQLMRDTGTRNAVTARLEGVGDMERIISKVAVGRVSPRELVFLRDSLAAVADLRQMCSGHESLTTIAEQLNPCTQLRERIEHEIVDDAPVAVNRGQVIKPGVDAELDELREIAFQGKDYLLRLQQRESETTGIGSLKIGYNNVFGYYIEVTNTHRDKVPPQWIRKQTLVNAERYITEELKQYEEKILTAQERIEIIENRLFAALVAAVSDYIQAIQLDATLIGRLDVLTSFARVSLANHYNRPVVDNSLELSLCEARHPVIERQLPESDPYIANSVTLNNESAQILMITGPNMSGKSALLRQTALNVIMAQTGCFVAADSAHIGIVDKVFTRVGASDNISLGESTFMVEMNEAASILNNMSRRSLILFDELGRGTSTYDGISIAWAIVEHIHNHNGIHPKTLFATHYHELNDMEAGFDRVKNYNVSVREINGKVVFLRKLSRGGSEHSFGIHVAKLAGMPPEIVARATEVLHRLESINSRETDETDEQAAKAARPDTHKLLQTENSPGMQLSFFQLDDPVLQQVRDEILNLDINNLTPMAALNKLHDIRIIITGK